MSRDKEPLLIPAIKRGEFFVIDANFDQHKGSSLASLLCIEADYAQSNPDTDDGRSFADAMQYLEQTIADIKAAFPLALLNRQGADA